MRVVILVMQTSANIWAPMQNDKRIQMSLVAIFEIDIHKSGSCKIKINRLKIMHCYNSLWKITKCFKLVLNPNYFFFGSKSNALLNYFSKCFLFLKCVATMHFLLVKLNYIYLYRIWNYLTLVCCLLIALMWKKYGLQWKICSWTA